MQFCVYQHRSTPDFAVPVKQHLALPADRSFFRRIHRIKHLVTRSRHAVLDQNFLGELEEIARAFGRDWFSAVTNEQDFRAKFS